MVDLYEQWLEKAEGRKAFFYRDGEGRLRYAGGPGGGGGTAGGTGGVAGNNKVVDALVSQFGSDKVNTVLKLSSVHDEILNVLPQSARDSVEGKQDTDAILRHRALEGERRDLETLVNKDTDLGTIRANLVMNNLYSTFNNLVNVRSNL